MSTAAAMRIESRHAGDARTGRVARGRPRARSSPACRGTVAFDVTIVTFRRVLQAEEPGPARAFATVEACTARSAHCSSERSRAPPAFVARRGRCVRDLRRRLARPVRARRLRQLQGPVVHELTGLARAARRPDAGRADRPRARGGRGGPRSPARRDRDRRADRRARASRASCSKTCSPTRATAPHVVDGHVAARALPSGHSTAAMALALAAVFAAPPGRGRPRRSSAPRSRSRSASRSSRSAGTSRATCSRASCWRPAGRCVIAAGLRAAERAGRPPRTDRGPRSRCSPSGRPPMGSRPAQCGRSRPPRLLRARHAPRADRRVRP